MCAKRKANATWGDVKNLVITDYDGRQTTVGEELEFAEFQGIPHSNTKVHLLDLWFLNDWLEVGTYNTVVDVVDYKYAERLFYEELLQEVVGYFEKLGITKRSSVLFYLAPQYSSDWSVLEPKKLDDISDNELENIRGISFKLALKGVEQGLEIPFLVKLGGYLHYLSVTNSEFSAFACSSKFYKLYLEAMLERVKKELQVFMDTLDFKEYYVEHYGDVLGEPVGTDLYYKLYDQYLELERRINNWV